MGHLDRNPDPGSGRAPARRVDHWLIEWQLADLQLGFYGELHATPELLPWLLSLEDGRINAAQRIEVEHIAHS